MPTPPRSVRPLPLTRRRSERQGSPKLFPPRQRPHRRCHACPVRPSFRPRRFCSLKGLGLESAGSTASPCPAYPADSPSRTSPLHGPAASGRPPTCRANPRRPTRAHPGPSSLPVHRHSTPASPTSRGETATTSAPAGRRTHPMSGGRVPIQQRALAGAVRRQGRIQGGVAGLATPPRGWLPARGHHAKGSVTPRS
jgi:hypothetical protein